MFLLLLSLVPICSAGRTCFTGNTILDPTNGPIWVPVKSNNAEPMAANQNCTYKLLVPVGKYVTVSLNYQLGTNDFFAIKSQQSNWQQTTGDQSPYLYTTLNDAVNLPASSYTLTLTTASNPGNFTMRLEQKNLPDFPVVELDPHASNIINLTALVNHTYRFYSTRLYTLRTAMGNWYRPYLLDSCFVYSDSTTNGVSYSGLTFLIDGVFPTFRNYMIIVCVDDRVAQNDALLVSSPIGQIATGSQWKIRITGNYTGRDLFDGLVTTGLAASFISTYCPGGCTEYLEYANMPDNSTGIFSMHYGWPGTQLSKIQSVTVVDQRSEQFFPQRMDGGEWRTYRADRTSVSLMWDSYDYKYTSLSSPGTRNGVFASRYYGTQKVQDLSYTLKASDSWKSFSFNVIDVDQCGSVTISVDGGKKNGEQRSFTYKDIASVWSAQGSSATFTYTSNYNSNATGALVSWEVISSANGMPFLILAVSILSYWIH